MNWKKLQQILTNSKYYYFHTDNGVLLCGDCLEVMKLIPKESIDLVLTDPPFGINHKNQGWDSIEFLSFTKIWLNVIRRILVSDGKIATYFPKKSFMVLGNILREMRDYRWDIVIQCKTFSQFRINYGYIDSWSPILVLHGKYKKINAEFNPRRNWFILDTANTSKKSSRNPRNFHPAGKDENAFEYLLYLLSNRSDIILDPFIGSGTTAIACEKLNRKWIGIEINPEYCEIAKQRIQKVLTQKEQNNGKEN